MQEIEKEKLRAFEQKMHNEGADGFADGPRPWETWDESGAQAGSSQQVWKGKARRIYKNTPVRRSLGDRVISGLAMIALVTMAVGIAGVYLTDDQPPTVAWTAIQPTPIPLPEQREAAGTRRLPARTQRPAPVIAEIDSLPPPAAGIEAVALDRPSAEMPAGEMMPLSAAGSEPAAAAPADNPTGETAASDPDIEIVKSPAALLLTSTGDGSPGDGYVASDVEMDPELAMEIATAPPAAGGMEAVPVAASGMLNRETGSYAAPVSTRTDGINRKAAPATDLINRGSNSLAGVNSAVPEAATATAGPATEPEPESMLEPAAGTTAALPDTPLPDTAMEEDTAAAEDAGNEATATSAATLEEIPPAATTGPATIPAEAADTVASDEIDMQAQAVSASSDEEPAAGENTVVALAEPKPVAAAAPAGDWVINLATYNHEAMAKKMLGEFQAKGVAAEIESAVIDDRTMYRVRVGGFESSRAARSGIATLEQKLGLKGVWISKR